MTKPTIREVKRLASFLAAFFVFTSVGQYLFVQHQMKATVRKQLENSALELDSAVDDSNGVDLKALNRVVISVPEYFTILSDGAVLEVSSGPRGLVSGLIPEVTCPLLSAAAYLRPVVTTYRIYEGTSERWWIYAKQLDSGSVVLGVSELDQVASPARKLEESITVFGTTVDSAQHVNTRKVDTDISAWAVIKNNHQLVGGYGRIPLQTDPMALGRIGAPGYYEKKIDGRTYRVLYAPLRDHSNNKSVGTIVVPQDITIEKGVLRSQVFFNAAVGGTSFLLFLVFSAFYSSRHEEERRKIKEAFQHYFSPQILETILREPALLELGGQRREVTIMFADIRSFTSLSETIPPQRLTQLLQEYFTAMTDAVTATDGVVDKYMGDGIMAFWGAPIEQPNQADRAVQTAIDMIARLKGLREHWSAEGLPFLDVGIGIDLGIVTVGNIGSSKRFDYTLVGDAVNAASRIEGLNKDFGSHILISDSTRKQLTTPIRTRDRGEVQIRGKEKPIKVFEVEAV
ncbi:MAG: adenylate/guanylate cyclase domain-containing protein [Gemmatimonadales bacterium]|jgi:class 3 adenylate cyclase